VVAALIGVLVTMLPSPKSRRVDELEPGEAQVYTPPKPIRLTPAMRREIDATVDEFVHAAVLRRDIPRSWELAAPDLRVGYTHAEWLKGELPVFPFPANPERTAWDLDYADELEVALNVTLVPRKGVADPPEVFGVSLAPVRRAGARRWLVAAWLPRGSVSQPQAALGETAPPPPQAMTPEEREAVRRASEGQIDRVWWLVPAGILALIVLGPITYFAVLRLRRSLRKS
jgi:hypothetical protein